MDHTGDIRYDYVQIPCGKCLECMRTRSSEWQFRIKYELKVSRSSYFITLTYDDDHLPSDGSLSKSELQRFFKRLRKFIPLRYFACGEYGDHFGRPHYHFLLFTDMSLSIDRIDKLLSRCWKLGFYKIGTVTNQSIAYVTKYMLKKIGDFKDSKQAPFQLMSRKPGLGSSFLTPQMVKYISQGDGKFDYMLDGVKVPIPRYFKDKILTKEQKEVQRYHYMEEVFEKGLFFGEKPRYNSPDLDDKIHDYNIKLIRRKNKNER